MRVVLGNLHNYTCFPKLGVMSALYFSFNLFWKWFAGPNLREHIYFRYGSICWFWSILISNAVCLENMQGSWPAFSAISILLALKFAASILRCFSASSLAALTAGSSIASSFFFFAAASWLNFVLFLSDVVITCGTVLLYLIIIPCYPPPLMKNFNNWPKTVRIQYKKCDRQDLNQNM